MDSGVCQVKTLRESRKIPPMNQAALTAYQAPTLWVSTSVLRQSSAVVRPLRCLSASSGVAPV